MAEDIYLTAQQVTEKFHIHRSSIYRYRKQGKLPAYGLEGKVLYKLSDIESLLIIL